MYNVEKPESFGALFQLSVIINRYKYGDANNDDNDDVKHYSITLILFIENYVCEYMFQQEVQAAELIIVENVCPIFVFIFQYNDWHREWYRHAV